MMRALRTLTLVLLAGTVAAACRQYLPESRLLHLRTAPAENQSTADARGKFNHDGHATALQQAGVSCLDCHRFDVRIETDNESLARELSAHALLPGSAACHACHRPGPLHVTAAPSACTTCHENLAPLRPANHDLSWLRVHASVARAQPEQCETCHRSAQCIDCHQRRDTIQTRVHERNFRFFHSVQARANPMQCGSCHRQDFCRNCHEASGQEAFP
jgi:hypothetical protein